MKSHCQQLDSTRNGEREVKFKNDDRSINHLHEKMRAMHRVGRNIIELGFAQQGVRGSSAMLMKRCRVAIVGSKSRLTIPPKSFPLILQDRSGGKNGI